MSQTGKHVSGWTIYADELHEGDWFRNLHPRLADATEEEITGAVKRNPRLERVLLYDRPDIVLTDGRDEPVLVVERTVEVPSGHNVGQRFARLAAAAEARVPVVYFGPYAARKHGGKTEGARFMNLRLFAALDHVARVNRSAVTCINWPVDSDFEIVRVPFKDDRLREYLNLFFSAYDKRRRADVNKTIRASKFEAEQLAERQFFSSTLRRASSYERPPSSVRIEPTREATSRIAARYLSEYEEIVLYKVGMRKIRSDPYTGMSMLYRYLYVLGVDAKRALILYLPHVTTDMWRTAARSGRRKDIRLFRIAADGILFRNNEFLPRDHL
jgi:hypothetical protein